MATERERISPEEAIRRGYLFGRIGYNHAAGRRIIAPLQTIFQLSPGGLLDIAELDDIRDSQADPEPAGDIPLVKREAV